MWCRSEYDHFRHLCFSTLSHFIWDKVVFPAVKLKLCDLIYEKRKKKLFSWSRWTEKLTPGRAVGTSQASLSWDIVQQGLVPPLFKTWSDHQLICGLQIYFRFLDQHALQGKAPRPLTQTGLHKLFAALRRKFPVSKFRLCIHFTCLRQSLRLVLPAADTSTLAGAAGNVHSAWFILPLPCVITALRFNSAAGPSDSSAFRSDAVHRARYCTLPVVLTRERLLQTRCLGFCLDADKLTLRTGTETLWDVSWQPAQNVIMSVVCLH